MSIFWPTVKNKEKNEKKVDIESFSDGIIKLFGLFVISLLFIGILFAIFDNGSQTENTPLDSATFKRMERDCGKSGEDCLPERGGDPNWQIDY